MSESPSLWTFRPLRWVCGQIARRMNAADASYPNPRLARWVRDKAGGILLCRYCGHIDWTIHRWGRATHKHACPFRVDTYCQSHPHFCEEMGQ